MDTVPKLNSLLKIVVLFAHRWNWHYTLPRKIKRGNILMECVGCKLKEFILVNKCEKCGKKIYRANPQQLYCGSWRKKEGCAYTQSKIRNNKNGKKWRKENPEYQKIYLKSKI